MQSHTEKKSGLVRCREMRTRSDDKWQERQRCKEKVVFTDREASRGESATQTQQRKRACVKDLEGERKDIFPHRMTLRSNPVICQPHRQHGWLMDWEGMRDTSSGNPSVVICSRHYQPYLLREPADNRADTGSGGAARTDGEHGR